MPLCINHSAHPVVGTSPKAQSVLAYLAHKADDRGVRKCYPDTESIASATHFGHTAVRDALNELRAANLLSWKTGGRCKGSRGMSLANEYVFNLPVDKSAPSAGREAAPAGAAGRLLQEPPDGCCGARGAATINPIQPEAHQSINGPEAVTELQKREFESLAEGWRVSAARANETADLQKREHRSLVDEAMAAAGVSDAENKRIFSSTLLRRDPGMCLEVIFEFASQRRAHEHDHLANPAACLNRLLARLPMVR